MSYRDSSGDVGQSRDRAETGRLRDKETGTTVVSKLSSPHYTRCCRL